MLVLFDHGTPKGLAPALSQHSVHTAKSRGWHTLSNSELLNAVEEAGVDVLLTTDRRIRYQQNLNVRRINLVVLTGSTKWSLVQHHTLIAVVADFRNPRTSPPRLADCLVVVALLSFLAFVWHRNLFPPTQDL